MSINWTLRRAPAAALFLFRQWLLFKWDHKVRGTYRETEMLNYVRGHATAGDPDSVLEAMDEFAREHRWLMNIGPVKGAILVDALRAAEAARVVEIGSYCGYSAVLIGNLVKPAGGRVVSIEKNRRFAGVAREIVGHAGLDAVVEIRNGTLESELAALEGPFDGVLLDHWKDEYLPDLQRLENAGLLAKGTVVIADNIDFFKVPDYLGYVRDSRNYASRFVEASVEYNEHITDGVEISVFRPPSL